VTPQPTTRTADAQTRLLESTYAWADQLQDTTRVYDEAGLFSTEPNGKKLQDVTQAVSDARVEAAEGHAAEALSRLSRGENQLFQTLYSQSAWWRWTRCYQLHIVAYYTLIFVVVLNVGSGALPVAKDIWGVPTEVLGLGALGAVLRGLWYLYKQVSQRKFRVQFGIAHLCAPIIGALFGMLIYFLLSAGLLTLAAGGSRLPVDSKILDAFALFSGYSWEWLLRQIDRLPGLSGGSGKSGSAPAVTQGSSKENGPHPKPAPSAAGRHGN